jgi:hypothetical protein
MCRSAGRTADSPASSYSAGARNPPRAVTPRAQVRRDGAIPAGLLLFGQKCTGSPVPPQPFCRRVHRLSAFTERPPCKRGSEMLTTEVAAGHWAYRFRVATERTV